MKKHTLLVIDDEQYILTSVARVLQSEEREVITANNAEDAWVLLKERGEVEVIICDNRLPGIAGIDFLIKAKRLYPDTIRILMTGYPDLTSTIDAINRAHIWRYVLKPVEAEELKVLVKQAFDYYAILKDNRQLLKIARQQAELIKNIRDKHPKVLSEEALLNPESFLDEKKTSESIAAFMNKYYPSRDAA